MYSLSARFDGSFWRRCHQSPNEASGSRTSSERSTCEGIRRRSQTRDMTRRKYSRPCGVAPHLVGSPGVPLLCLTKPPLALGQLSAPAQLAPLQLSQGLLLLLADVLPEEILLAGLQDLS